jgi:hypothetical protein
MTSIQQSSGQGALFELVARGIKDKYFVEDSKESHFTYSASYPPSLPHLKERKTAVPVNGTHFGSTFEVEIDRYADILTECSLDIQLPTWFPPLPIDPQGGPVDPSIANGLYSITDSNGLSYGYVNGCGYFLFEKIQFYQDKALIQEWSGDGLLVKQLTEGSRLYSDLRLMKGGWTGNGLRELQLRATPSSLRIYLPLPGLQSPDDVGLPLCAMTWQTLRLRVTLRKLEDLVCCSDETLFKPTPWTALSFQYTLSDGSTIHTVVPRSLYDIGHPTIVLSTVQHYLPAEAQQAFKDMVIQIPFRRVFENRFTFGELDFISLDKGGVSAVTRRLEGRHPTERLFWFFRLGQTVDRNRLDDFTNTYFNDQSPSDTQPYTEPYGGFYYQLKLLIAGRDREHLESGLVWNQLTPWSKQERVGPVGVGEMRWSLGDQMDVSYPSYRLPEGTVNFTTADRPTLYVELANVPVHPLHAQRLVEMRALSEAWNVYEIKEGRGRMLFAS